MTTQLYEMIFFKEQKFINNSLMSNKYNSFDNLFI